MEDLPQKNMRCLWVSRNLVFHQLIHTIVLQRQTEKASLNSDSSSIRTQSQNFVVGNFKGSQEKPKLFWKKCDPTRCVSSVIDEQLRCARKFCSSKSVITSKVLLAFLCTVIVKMQMLDKLAIQFLLFCCEMIWFSTTLLTAKLVQFSQISLFGEFYCARKIHDTGEWEPVKHWRASEILAASFILTSFWLESDNAYEMGFLCSLIPFAAAAAADCISVVNLPC